MLGVLVAAVQLLSAPARADDPKFAYGKAGDLAKLPPWAASVQAGFGMTTGNAESLNLTGAGMVSHRFTPDDLLAFAGGDVPAGKQFVGGAQAGSSRALYKTATNELVGEIGLDYTYQRYVVGDPNSLNIAAIRAYLGNLNEENTPTGRVGSFGDNRAVGKIGVTWKIFGDGSMGFRFRALYDSAPAPKPPPAGFSWAAGYQPLANPWDTFTELVLVYKLL